VSIVPLVRRQGDQEGLFITQHSAAPGSAIVLAVLILAAGLAVLCPPCLFGVTPHGKQRWSLYPLCFLYALPFPLLPSGACLLWCEGFIRYAAHLRGRRPGCGVKANPHFRAGRPDVCVIAFPQNPLCACFTATPVGGLLWEENKIASSGRSYRRPAWFDGEGLSRIRYALPYPLLPPDGLFLGKCFYRFSARPTDKRPDSGSVAFFALRPAVCCEVMTYPLWFRYALPSPL